MFGASSSFAPSSAGSFFQQNQLGAQQPAPGSSQSGFQQPGYGQQQGGNVGGYGSQQSQPHQQQAGGYGAQGFGGQAGHAGAAGQGGLWGSASSSNLYGSTQQPSTGTGSLFPIGSTSGFGQPSGFGTSASGLPPTGNPTGADGPRRYIPGFLSSSSLGGNGPGTPQGYGAGTSQLSRDTSDEWVSTPSGGARATSPKAGFRSVAGQFGQRECAHTLDSNKRARLTAHFAVHQPEALLEVAFLERVFLPLLNRDRASTRWRKTPRRR